MPITRAARTGTRFASILVLFLSIMTAAHAGLPFDDGGTHAAGVSDWTALGCNDCHGSVPSPNLVNPPGNYPGANVPEVIYDAINGDVSQMAGIATTSQQRTDLARYIGDVVPPSASGFNMGTVPYNGNLAFDFTSHLNGVCNNYATCNPAPTYNGSITAVSVVSQGAKGSAVITITASSASVTYTANAGAFGADSFTYHATGPGGSSATVTVNLTIATPASPTLTGVTTQNITYSSPSTAHTIALAGFIGGGPTNASPLSIATQGAHGTAVAVANSTNITYTPNAGYYGADSVVVTVSGPGGSNNGSVPIQVNVPAPTDANGGTTIAYNGTVNIDLSTLVSPVVSGTTYALNSQPTDATGTLTVSGSMVSYTASPTFYGGTDSFTFHAISPGPNAGNVATYTITVNKPPTPVAASSSSAVVFDSSSNNLPLSITNPVASIAVVTAPAHGTAVVSGTTLSYTPSAGYTGPDSIVYTASGPNTSGTSAPATISITVSQPAAPTAGNASSNVSYNVAKSIDLTSAIGGAAQSVTIATNPAHGTAVPGSGLTVLYTPANNYTGADSFTYTAVGFPAGNNSATPGTVTITVSPPGAPSDANVSGVMVGYNSGAVSIPLAGSITSTGPVTGVTVGTAAHGTTSVTGTTAMYTPTSGYYGTDSFTYIASNQGGPGNSASISLTVANPPKPVTANATLSVPYNGNSTVNLASSTTGVYTPPLVIITNPAHGAVTVSGTMVTYTATLGTFGSDSFTYAANGPGGQSTPATVSVTTATPSAPGAGNTTLAVTYGQAKTIDLSLTATGVVTSYAIAAQPAHGSVNLPPGSSVATYTPANLYFGADSFTYTVTGPGGTSAAGTVTVTVGNPPAPVVMAGSANVGFDTVMTVNLSSSVSGVFTSTAISSAPTHGVASIANNVVTYTPTSGYFGADSLNFTATGPGGTSTPATLSLNVVRPPPPVALPTSAVDAFNQPVVIDLSQIVAGFATSVAVSTPPGNGSASASGLKVTYTPQAGYFGSDGFSYTVTGPGGTSAPANVSITVQTTPAHAWNTTMTVALNTSGKLDLSKWITGSGITGAAIVTPPAHGSASMAGTMLTYTPNKDYFGTDRLTYRAFGVSGTSNIGTITITVTGRPDPTQNQNVTGVVTSEAASAQRFARVQSSNFQSHLSALHANSIEDEDDEERPEDRTRQPGAVPPPPAGGYSFGQPQQTAALLAARGASSSGNSVGIDSSGSSQQAAPLLAGTPSANGLTSAATVRSDGVGVAGAGLFGAASMQRAAYFPGTPPNYVDNGTLLSQSITSVDLGSLAGTMMGDQTAASLDHNGLSSVWVLGSVSFGQRSPGGPTQNFGTDGITFGIDYRLSRQLVIGVGAGYGHDQTSIGTDGTHTRANGVDVATYASYAPSDHTFIDAVIGVGSLNFDASRTVAPIDASATSHRSGDEVFASIAAGYDWHKNGLHATPYVRLDASQTDLDSTTESGAGEYNLNYGKQDQTSVAAALGLRLETTQTFDLGVVKPHASIEYEHEFDDNQAVNLNYANFTGTNYTITPNVLDRNTVTLGFGADFLMRHGLSVGWDYQILHASGIENSQSIRVKISQDLDQNFVLPVVAIHPLANVRADLGYTYDDNITRSTDKLADQTWSLGLSRLFVMQLNDNSRVSLEPSAGFEKFENYVGLSHADAGVKAELQYRESGDFSSPIYSFFTKLSGSNYETSLRDGERLQIGATYYMPVTDRINGFAAIGADARHASNEVFNGVNGFVRVNLDYAVTPEGTFYLGGEYRNGDLVSTGFPSLANLDSAKILVVDDAFKGTGRIAYRFNGEAGIGTFGYNLGISSTSSVDLSYRIVLASPDHQPQFVSAPTIRYVDHQLGLVYLVRF